MQLYVHNRLLYLLEFFVICFKWSLCEQEINNQTVYIVNQFIKNKSLNQFDK